MVDPWSQDMIKIEEQTKESEATCESQRRVIENNQALPISQTQRNP